MLSCRKTCSLNSAGVAESSAPISSSLSGTRSTKPSFDHIDSISRPRSARSWRSPPCTTAHEPPFQTALVHKRAGLPSLAARFDQDLFVVWNPAQWLRAGLQDGPEGFRGRGIETVVVNQLAEGDGSWQTKQLAAHFSICRPNSTGRSALSPRQKGILPGSPGAGETSTWLCEISSILQVDAPRTIVSPLRLSKTISSSSSPTRAPPCRASQKHTVKSTVGYGAAVNDRDTCEPCRDVREFATRSHVIRGRSSVNSSDG